MDVGVILGHWGHILRASGGFKLGQILGLCSGEAGGFPGGTLSPETARGAGLQPQIPKRRPSFKNTRNGAGAEHFSGSQGLKLRLSQLWVETGQ